MVKIKRFKKGKFLEDHIFLNNVIEKAKNEHKKIIYCGLGSMDEASVKFVRKLLTAVKSENNWILIVSAGQKTPLKDIREKPDNALFLDWVSQPEILRNVDCCINHGGMNTINECIINKVPMLVYSGRRYDQDGNAARIKYHKLGIVGNPENDKEEVIKENISKILYQHSFKTNIEKFNALNENYKAFNLSSIMHIKN